MIKVLALAAKLFFGGSVTLPREVTLALSDRGLMATVGGGAVPCFFCSIAVALAVDVAVDVAVVINFVALLPCLLLVRPLSLGHCVALCH